VPRVCCGVFRCFAVLQCVSRFKKLQRVCAVRVSLTQKNDMCFGALTCTILIISHYKPPSLQSPSLRASAVTISLSLLSRHIDRMHRHVERETAESRKGDLDRKIVP